MHIAGLCYRNVGCLIRRSDQVVGVIGVPFGDEFIAGLADEFAVDDRAAEDTRDVESVTESGIRSILDVERAIESDAGRPGAEPIHFDGASSAAELEDLIAQFLDAVIERAFNDARGARCRADQLRLLNGVALLDAGTVGVDRLDSVCHFIWLLKKYDFILP